MNILYIHQHFTTNRGSSGTRSYDVSRHLATMGHKVTMICGIGETSGLEPMAWYRPFRKTTMVGCSVIVCNVRYSNGLSSLGRMWAFCWFVVLATVAAISVRGVDSVFATSTPLTVGVPGYLAARLKRVPFVFEVRDIWPETFIRSGWFTGEELPIRLMSRLEGFLYKNAQRILLVSPGFQERLVERGFPVAKMRTILLGADGSLFHTLRPDQEFLRRYGLESRVLAIYTGAHGRENALEYVIDAAEIAKRRTDIAFVLVGAGGQKGQLQEYARQKGLGNVVFADPVSKERIAGVLAACHMGLMILKAIGQPRSETPNKIFDYMFAGLPSLVNFEGPALEMVTKEKCGLYVDPKHPEDLAVRVIELADDPRRRRQMGSHGRSAAFEKYDRRIIARQLAETFEEVVAEFRGFR